MNPRHDIEANYDKLPNVVIRHNKTLRYLESYRKRLSDARCLEIGDPTSLTDRLKVFPIRSIQNTDFDLDECGPDLGRFDVIFCFEVIEHLCDPLQFLRWCEKSLMPGGVIFLSTPQRKPNWLRDKEHHFHEFNRNELEYVIRKAGLEIADSDMFCSVPWYWCFRGLRPILRFIRWNRTGLFLLTKKRN